MVALAVRTLEAMAHTAVASMAMVVDLVATPPTIKKQTAGATASKNMMNMMKVQWQPLDERKQNLSLVRDVRPKSLNPQRRRSLRSTFSRSTTIFPRRLRLKSLHRMVGKPAQIPWTTALGPFSPPDKTTMILTNFNPLHQPYRRPLNLQYRVSHHQQTLTPL